MKKMIVLAIGVGLMGSNMAFSADQSGCENIISKELSARGLGTFSSPTGTKSTLDSSDINSPQRQFLTDNIKSGAGKHFDNIISFEGGAQSKAKVEVYMQGHTFVGYTSFNNPNNPNGGPELVVFAQPECKVSAVESFSEHPSSVSGLLTTDSSDCEQLRNLNTAAIEKSGEIFVERSKVCTAYNSAFQTQIAQKKDKNQKRSIASDLKK